jgi:coiled-coil domain-containing protein 40
VIVRCAKRCALWTTSFCILQVDAQKAETRAALETLMEAEQEMDSIHFEKRQLTAQWRSSLLAITRREEALAAIKAAIGAQEEQERSIASELHRFRKDIQEQQARCPCRTTPC